VAAAGNAALQVLVESNWINEVSRKESIFRQQLVHPAIKAIHGKGLMLAVEMADFETVQLCIQKMLNKGLFSDWFLYAPNCLRLSPPLSILDEEIHWACERIIEAIEEI
jgi:acetylornithine/succinyldiaminopimelate/putrescine aminotransferase